MNQRRVLGVVLCCVLPAALAFTDLEQVLLERGFLNRKDLPPVVGNEPGDLGDHLLNVWWWDAASFLLFVISFPCLFLGIRMLARASTEPATSAGAS